MGRGGALRAVGRNDGRERVSWHGKIQGCQLMAARHWLHSLSRYLDEELCLITLAALKKSVFCFDARGQVNVEIRSNKSLKVPIGQVDTPGPLCCGLMAREGGVRLEVRSASSKASDNLDRYMCSQSRVCVKNVDRGSRKSNSRQTEERLGHDQVYQFQFDLATLRGRKASIGDDNLWRSASISLLRQEFEEWTRFASVWSSTEICHVIKHFGNCSQTVRVVMELAKERKKTFGRMAILGHHFASFEETNTKSD